MFFFFWLGGKGGAIYPIYFGLLVGRGVVLRASYPIYFGLLFGEGGGFKS